MCYVVFVKFGLCLLIRFSWMLCMLSGVYVVICFVLCVGLIMMMLCKCVGCVCSVVSR